MSVKRVLYTPRRWFRAWRGSCWGCGRMTEHRENCGAMALIAALQGCLDVLEEA